MHPNRQDGAPKCPWEINRIFCSLHPNPLCHTQAKLLPKLIKQKGEDRKELNPGQVRAAKKPLEKALEAFTA